MNDFSAWEARVSLLVHPDIHPDDARAAFRAWFRRTLLDRECPPHIVFEKGLLAGGKKNIKRTIKGPRAPFIETDKFDQRRRRAKKDGRAPFLDSIDNFILRNWRKMRPVGSMKWDPRVPGLRDWAPKAACALIRASSIGRQSGGENWYSKKRSRLELAGKTKYRVVDFKAFRNHTFFISLRS